MGLTRCLSVGTAQCVLESGLSFHPMVSKQPVQRLGPQKGHSTEALHCFSLVMSPFGPGHVWGTGIAMALEALTLDLIEPSEGREGDWGRLWPLRYRGLT